MSSIEITPFNVLLGLAINGIFSGLGTAIGIYIANKHIIKKVGMFKRKISNFNKKKIKKKKKK